MFRYYIVTVETEYGIRSFKFHSQTKDMEDVRAEVIDAVQTHYDGCSKVKLHDIEEEQFVVRI